MEKTDFDRLALIEPLLSALRREEYETPTPIQAEAIPHLLAGRDLLGCARTGTGKTAAFALPTLQWLAEGSRSGPKAPRALVLTPTRELAVQIGRSFAVYGRYLKLKHAVIHGGVSIGPQARALSRGVDILVATPGRLLDLVGQKMVRLDRVEIFTLDEADRMLDMGFIGDVRKIVSWLPERRQSLFFSATMPPDVSTLAQSMLRDPARVTVDPVSSTNGRVDQKVLFVDRSDKNALLTDLLRDETVARALVFTRTKHQANRVALKLSKQGERAEAIHGNKSQGARQKALDNFMAGRLRVLVATDIAARGIDVEGITHVINFELPNDPVSYIHRIGRTARAGADGIAISLCDADERAYLRAIERLADKTVTVIDDHPYHSEKAAAAPSRNGVNKGGHWSYKGRNAPYKPKSGGRAAYGKRTGRGVGRTGGR